jgi:hypothetical protein
VKNRQSFALYLLDAGLLLGLFFDHEYVPPKRWSTFSGLHCLISDDRTFRNAHRLCSGMTVLRSTIATNCELVSVRQLRRGGQVTKDAHSVMWARTESAVDVTVGTAKSPSVWVHAMLKCTSTT